MAPKPNMASAAARHLECAEVLLEDRVHPPAGQRRAEAGYLLGLSAECSVKALLLAMGLRPLGDAQRRDDPIFAHYPELRTMLRDQVKGRRGQELLPFIADNFLANWDVAMRYLSPADVPERDVGRWLEDARRARSAA